MVTWVINIISWIVGIVSVVMIIWGGFQYITSGGNDTKVTSAKNTILYAIIGLVIVALAQIIVKFVIGKITSQIGNS
jgi:TRAP-type C4-dicarboxylate transport system permease small subunit